MSGQDNFNTALAALGDKLTALDTAIQAGIVELKAAFEANNDAAFQVAADKLSGFTARIVQETADLVAAEQPPASPAPVEPAPVVTEPAPAPVVSEPAPAPVEPAPVAVDPSPAPAPVSDAPSA